MSDQPDPITRRAEAIRYRNPALCLDVLALLEHKDEDRILLGRAIEGRHEVTDSTVSKTLGDLIELGAIRSFKSWQSKRSSYRLTPLGRAWLARQVQSPEIPTFEIEEQEQGPRPHWGSIEEETS